MLIVGVWVAPQITSRRSAVPPYVCRGHIHDIAVQLPLWVGETINQVVHPSDGEHLEPEQVVVLVHEFNPLSQNTPDIWIDIQCEGPAAQGNGLRHWRGRIAEQVAKKLRAQLDANHLHASTAVGCRPLSGSGIQHTRSGDSSKIWGHPRALS